MIQILLTEMDVHLLAKQKLVGLVQVLERVLVLHLYAEMESKRGLKHVTIPTLSLEMAAQTHVCKNQDIFALG